VGTDRIIKRPRAGRLVWYRERADPEFWHDYFVEKVTADWFDGYRRKDLRKDGHGRILSDVLPRTGKVLEAGAGAGTWVATLQGNGYDVEGVEYSRKLVERIHEVDPTVPVRYGDVLALDVPDGTYRSYLSFGVVEHREEGPEPFLTEAYRVLEPGGTAVIMVPVYGPVRRLKARLGLYGRGDVDGLPFYQYAYRPAEIARYVADAGFLVQATPTYSLDRMLREEAPWFGWLVRQRGGRLLQQFADRTLGRYDGHMVAVVATKPGR